MTELEKRFHADMIGIYEAAKRECNYNATRFLQMVTERGGVETAHRLLATPESASGFTTLWEHGRLDLSVEALVLRLQYSSLFTKEERAMARERLARYGYKAATKKE